MPPSQAFAMWVSSLLQGKDPTKLASHRLQILGRASIVLVTGSSPCEHC
jgi:hypothetical protein